jgi:hypothetical protein
VRTVKITFFAFRVLEKAGSFFQQPANLSGGEACFAAPETLQ